MERTYIAIGIAIGILLIIVSILIVVVSANVCDYHLLPLRSLPVLHLLLLLLFLFILLLLLYLFICLFISFKSLIRSRKKRNRNDQSNHTGEYIGEENKLRVIEAETNANAPHVHVYSDEVSWDPVHI